MRDTVKIFVGNVDDRTTQEEMSELFEKYGTVVSCAVMKQYAFVHMRGTDRAMKAIEELNGRELNGRKMVVELSKPKPQNTWKIFVGNVGSGCEVSEIRAMFEAYGRVVECDVVKDYAFVHMEKESDARSAIESLNGKEIKGKRMNVEMSIKTQRPLNTNGSSHNSRLHRSHEFRDMPQSRSGAYDHRRATEAAYGAYSLESPYERYAGKSARYNEYERARPPYSFPYLRDRSPLQRLSPSVHYDAMASKYHTPISGYGSSAYEGHSTSSLSSAFSSQSSALSSAYGSRASAIASGYGNQAGFNSQTSAYSTESPSSYVSQNSIGYGTQGSSLPVTYGSQQPSIAPSFGSQTVPSAYPSHTATAPSASSPASGNAYQQQSSVYESSQITGLGSQSAYSSLPASIDAPLYDHPSPSTTQISASDSYKASADGYARYAPDPRFSKLADYRSLTQETQDAFHQLPPKSQLDSLYSSYGDSIRAGQISGYCQQL